MAYKLGKRRRSLGQSFLEEIIGEDFEVDANVNVVVSNDTLIKIFLTASLSGLAIIYMNKQL